MLYVCKCGYPVWAEFHWNGLESIPYYFDDWENSPTWGQAITRCPQCGESLSGGHHWWVAQADTPDGFLELWETTIRIAEREEDG